MKRDALFPPQSTWWPLGMSLDEWQASRRAGVPVQVYFTEAKEAEIAEWWQRTEPNRARQRDGG